MRWLLRFRPCGGKWGWSWDWSHTSWTALRQNRTGTKCGASGQCSGGGGSSRQPLAHGPLSSKLSRPRQSVNTNWLKNWKISLPYHEILSLLVCIMTEFNIILYLMLWYCIVHCYCQIKQISKLHLDHSFSKISRSKAPFLGYGKINYSAPSKVSEILNLAVKTSSSHPISIKHKKLLCKFQFFFPIIYSQWRSHRSAGQN